LTAGCLGPKTAPPDRIEPPPSAAAPMSAPAVAPVTGLHVPDKRQLVLDENRSDLAICVQVAAEANVDPAVVQTAAKAALTALAARDTWTKRGYDLLQNRVEVGCPAAPHLLEPGVKRIPAGLASDPIPYVAHASPYMIFLFVLPDADINRVFGDTFQRTSAQEYLRQGDSAIPVTIGLYLAPSEIQPDRLDWALSQALLL
jgi:hypothetical protein